MFDLIVLLIIAVSALVGFVRGAVREVVAVISFFLAAMIALLALPITAPMAIKAVTIVWLGKAMALLVIFVAAFIVLRLLGSSFGRRLHDYSGLGAVDRAIGTGFGLIRALVILGLFNLLLTVATPVQRVPGWITDSTLYPLTTVSGQMLRALAPHGFAVADKVGPAIERVVKDSDNSAQDSASEEGYDAATRKRMEDLVERSR